MAEMVRNIVERSCEVCYGHGQVMTRNALGRDILCNCKRCGGTGKAPVVTGSLADKVTDSVQPPK